MLYCLKTENDKTPQLEHFKQFRVTFYSKNFSKRCDSNRMLIVANVNNSVNNLNNTCCTILFA